MMLAGCVTSGDVGTSRALPANPAFVRPVEVTDPKPGENAIEIAGRERAGRVEANRRLILFGDWYDARREEYRGGR